MLSVTVTEVQQELVRKQHRRLPCLGVIIVQLYQVVDKLRSDLILMKLL